MRPAATIPAPGIPAPLLELVRGAYARDGEDFRFLPLVDPARGYFVEPWTNECLTGPRLTPDQPEPVSLDESDDEISRHEQFIREWISACGHDLAMADVIPRAPAHWRVLAHRYEADTGSE